MTKTDELFANEIAKLQNQLSTLQNQLSALNAGCMIKHRLNLTAEITKLETKLQRVVTIY